MTNAAAPVGVDGPVCYGSNLHEIAVNLVVFLHVPVERAALLIADLTGGAHSTRWVSAQVARCADALADAVVPGYAGTAVHDVLAVYDVARLRHRPARAVRCGAVRCAF